MKQKTQPKWYDVPAGTKVARCRGPNCRAEIFFVKQPSGRQMPVDCDIEGGERPTPTEFADGSRGGRGISHYHTCPDAKRF